MELTKNTKLLLLGGGLIGIYFFLTKTTEPMYYVPNVGDVLESELPNYGYTNVNGKWFTQEQINYATTQAGVPAGQPVDNSMEVWMTIVGVLDTVLPLIANATSGNNNP